jgi:hypothetical protein
MRKVNGGVPDGTKASDVLSLLGNPMKEEPGAYEAEEIWTYELGEVGGSLYRYSVLIDQVRGDVSASWWAQARRA